MELRFGQHIDSVAADGTPLRAAVFNENEVRAPPG